MGTTDTKNIGAATEPLIVGTLKIRLNAKHPIINLPIVTGLGTPNESIARGFDRL